MNSHNQEEIAEMAAIGKEMEGFMKDQMNISDEQLPNYNLDVNLPTSAPASSLPAESNDSSLNPLREISLDTSTKLTPSLTSAEVSSNVSSETAANGGVKSIQIIKAGTGNR